MTATPRSPIISSMMRLDDLAHLLHSNMTPIIIANAAIIAFISQRSMHLSDRVRANVDESLYKIHQPTVNLTDDEKETRLASLEEQNKLFILRHKGINVAFVLASLSFIMFSAASILVSGVDHEGWITLGARISILAFLMTGLGFLFLLVEFTSGFMTLSLNTKIPAKLINNKIKLDSSSVTEAAVD